MSGIRTEKEIENQISEIDNIIDTYSQYPRTEHVKMVLNQLNGQLKTLKWVLGLEDKIGL